MNTSILKKHWQKMICIFAVLFAFAVAILGPTVLTADAAEIAGTPYNTEGEYDVSVPHVVVNQVYGGSDDGYASHSFIELYNPTDQSISLDGWSVQYRSSADGDQSAAWTKQDLSGSIEARGYYLIRCAAVTDTANVAYQVPAGQSQWDIALHNKGVSVALMSNQTLLTSNNVMEADGFVDLAAANGNDGFEEQKAPAVEGTASDVQSKKKAIRRVEFADTDNNSADFQIVDYSEAVSEDLGPHGAATTADEAKQVNVHMGMTADTVYLSFTTATDAKSVITVTPQNGTPKTYEDQSVYSETTGKYMHTVTLDGLTADTHYTYTVVIGDHRFEGAFDTAKTKDSQDDFTFAFITDPQVSTASDAEAAGYTMEMLSEMDLDYIYIAGDITNTATNETQWEILFNNDGAEPDGGQDLFGNKTVVVTQGNHDNAWFTDHIEAPSANESVGDSVYAFDYGNMKFIVLNLETAKNDEAIRTAQKEYLTAQVADAKTNGQWIVVGFHKSIYTGASHIVDSDVIAARTYWGPVLNELGVDIVLMGHDHVYSRGFVTAEGNNAGLVAENGVYTDPDDAILYMVGGHAGGLKWYSKKNYEVSAGDLLAANYEFLDKNSADDGSDVKKEQVYTLVHVDGNTIDFTTYMYKYDPATDQVVTEPYVYDSFTVEKPIDVTEQYTDVETGAWYVPAIQYVVDESLFNGIDETTFGPDETMTRAMFVSVLGRHEGIADATAETPSVTGFTDVVSTEYYASHVHWAAENGVVEGYSDTTYAPYDNMTREQMVTMMYRYAKFLEKDVTVENSNALDQFSDGEKVADWSKEAMIWAVENGIVEGMDDGTLYPQGTSTRAQVATVLQRFLSEL